MSVPSAVALVPRFTPCQGEGNKLEVEEVWQEVEQAPCTLHIAHVEDGLHSHTTALNCYFI